MTASSAAAAPISDEHSVLLWQTCTYADDLGDAARTRRRLTPARDAMLDFLHYRLLPHLTNEERRLARHRLRDGGLLRLLATDHERLRADVDNVESCRTGELMALAASVLVERLDRHLRREESWLADPFTDPLDDPTQADAQDWALPLLFSDVIDVAVLPAEHRDALVRQRLAWLRAGETVCLEADSELPLLWQRRHAVDRSAHSWVYEQEGPTRWRARITRRADGA